MAIKIYKDKIEFIDGANVFTLTETTAGFDLNGTLTADSFGSVFQGTIAGYSTGGGTTNIIDKFPFAVDANATDVGDLTRTLSDAAGQSSATHGYTSGGRFPGTQNIIDKFPFSSGGNATDVGDLTSGRYGSAGHSSSSHGYTSSGMPITNGNIIDRFLFASDGNATDVGDLTRQTGDSGGNSSSTHGYHHGGSPLSNVINKFPFATNANATNVGVLPTIKVKPVGQSSSTHGYATGGNVSPFPPVIQNTIERFPFATDANGVDVGDLAVGRYGPAGQSSTTSGYASGGNTIDKFPFAAVTTNAANVGNLTVGRSTMGTGQQD